MKLTEMTSHLTKRSRGAREQVKEAGRTSGDKLDEARHWTAEEVRTAASSIRRAGRYGSRGIDDMASAAADGLDSTAAYIRNHNARSVFADLRQVMSRHPVGLLVAAGAIGFLFVAASRAQRQD